MVKVVHATIDDGISMTVVVTVAVEVVIMVAVVGEMLIIFRLLW